MRNAILGNDPKCFSILVHYYYNQYARSNDKLPSVKRAFLWAKREMRGLKMHLPS